MCRVDFTVHRAGQGNGRANVAVGEQIIEFSEKGTDEPYISVQATVQFRTFPGEGYGVSPLNKEF